MRTKNRKERGEPGKIYHVRNVIGRENLITSGRTNELAHAAWTELQAMESWAGPGNEATKKYTNKRKEKSLKMKRRRDGPKITQTREDIKVKVNIQSPIPASFSY